MRCFCIPCQRKYGPSGQLVTGRTHATHMRRERERIQAPRHPVASETLVTSNPIWAPTYPATLEILVTSDSIWVSTYPAISETLVTSDQQTELDLMEIKKIEKIEEVEEIEEIKYSEESSDY